MTRSRYDIIGDIHGQADKLIALLTVLGYELRDGAWRHPERIALFVGDFVDRGPRQLDTLKLVRNMVEAGSAIALMGNHELNAIAWNTEDGRGGHLRPRHGAKGERNRDQHSAFLSEVESEPHLHTSWTNWFFELPLFVDLPELRAVHACWSQSAIDWLSPHLKDGRLLTPELISRATVEPFPGALDSPSPSVYQAVETLLKGVEIELPGGLFFLDGEAHRRFRTRSAWWDQSAQTCAQAALVPPEIKASFPSAPLPERAKIALSNDKPTFFGHYWMTGEPAPLSDWAACVDYSAARRGPLVAYQLDEPGPLRKDRFVAAGAPLIITRPSHRG